MSAFHRICLALGLLLVGCGTWSPASAARSYDSCVGYIQSLPATITAPGTWCLKGTLYTSQTSGAAITIGADNVTLDCNDFRITGLGADWRTTAAIGVLAGAGRQGAIVRNCRIQGFRYGIQLQGAHHLVEGNAVDRSRYIGIYLHGDGMVVRDNTVLDTLSPLGSAYGIYATVPQPAAASAQIVGNTIYGVSAQAEPQSARGILATGLVEGNRVGGAQVGIKIAVGGVVRGNLVERASGTSYIVGSAAATTVCVDNNVLALGEAEGGLLQISYIQECTRSGHNLVGTYQPPPI